MYVYTTCPPSEIGAGPVESVRCYAYALVRGDSVMESVQIFAMIRRLGLDKTKDYICRAGRLVKNCLIGEQMSAGIRSFK